MRIRVVKVVVKVVASFYDHHEGLFERRLFRQNLQVLMPVYVSTANGEMASFVGADSVIEAPARGGGIGRDVSFGVVDRLSG